jgi:YrbI family 3-deoxy-D-manno-octulosonate 8-phosphate phosphatase
MTKGELNFFVKNDGSVDEFKSFSAIDGLGLIIWSREGMGSAIITGRSHPSTVHRARDCGMKYIYQGSLGKKEPFEDLLKKENLQEEKIAYIGDDLIDLPLLERVGLACCPQNAAEEVKAASHFIAKNKGGEGVVREVVEFILKAQGKWDEVVAKARRGEMARAKKDLHIISYDHTK